MKSDSSHGDAILAQAARLLTRRDAGWTSDEAAEFELWRAADPAHDAAVRRLESTQRLLSQLPESPAAEALLREADALCRERQVTRFPVWARWLSGLAAAACIALGVWSYLPPSTVAPMVFAAAHDRTVDLSDGSTLQMGAGSSVAVALTTAERRITLREGLVHFSVAKDPGRPFIVTAGSVSVRAVGTAFRVKHTAGAIEVSVTEGKVEVTRADPSARASRPLFLVAGEGVAFEAESGVAPAAAEDTVGRRVVGHVPWRAPRLEFSDTPLSEVVARFNRYSRVQLELGDAALASRPVGGTFDADQAEVFVKLLAAAGDVQVQRVSETHLILRKAR